MADRKTEGEIIQLGESGELPPEGKAYGCIAELSSPELSVDPGARYSLLNQIPTVEPSADLTHISAGEIGTPGNTQTIEYDPSEEDFDQEPKHWRQDGAAPAPQEKYRHQGAENLQVDVFS